MKTELNSTEFLILFNSVSNHTPSKLIFCQVHSLAKWKEDCDYGYVGWVEGKQQLLLFAPFSDLILS